MTNPLLTPSPLPPFARIRAEHIEPAIREILADNRAWLAELLARPGEPSWQDTIVPVDLLNQRLARTWSPASHLHAVADNEALREAYNRCLAEITDYQTELAQNPALYAAYRAVADRQDFPELDLAAQRSVTNGLREFRLAGVHLPVEERRAIRELRQQLSAAQARFEQNLLDATQAWTLDLPDASRLAGLPEGGLALARSRAQRAGVAGYRLTLDFPSYLAVMTYAEDRRLRQEMYTAYVTRASDCGPDAGRFDNSGLMLEILRLRHAIATRTGFESFAHYSLATKMAKTPDDVLGFLGELATRGRPMAEAEYRALEAFAREDLGASPLEAWDLAYYSERLRQRDFAVSQDALRPYFPLPRVLDGLFEVVRRLYGVRIRPRDGVETWHPDVRFYELHDEAGEPRGMFYLDPYARTGKRGGAWMDECRVRHRNGAGIEPPVAYLTCNFTPPVDGAPALLTHTEVITLFHEFGHGLHHMLTRVDWPAVSGINGVAWDAVELPSQLMENWCWEPEALRLISGHYLSGAPIDADTFQRMLAARHFQAAMQLLRQVEFAWFDFALHLRTDFSDPGIVQHTLDAVRERVAVVRPPAFNRFQHSFAHIFSGGYAAGYYSYKWAEVLSADAFSLFEQRGVFDVATARSFLHSVLEQGGSRDAEELFREFRGRPPDITPLLRHSGLVTS
jgi:oligopeptidase A